MDELIAAHPEDKGGDSHQDAWNAKCPMGSVPFEDPWCKQGRDEGANVDGNIEPAKDLCKPKCVALAKLVPNMCGDSRLDSTRPQRNKGKTGHHPGFGGEATRTHEREGEMPKAVDHR